MRAAKVTVPAAITDLGPGINSLGLALALHNTVDIRLRPDDRQEFYETGIGAGVFASSDHPALIGAQALFKAADQPMPGLDVLCQGNIPPGCGLSDASVWLVGGLFAANNLLEMPLPRDKVTALACDLVSRPVEAITSIVGGLALVATARPPDHPLTFRRADLMRSIQVILIVPQSGIHRRELPTSVTPDDLAFYIGRAALTAELLRAGDLPALAQAMRDPLRDAASLHPGIGAAMEAARQEGAACGAISGGGPAFVLFAKTNHERIETVVQRTLADHHIASRAWTLNVDTQGVAISAYR